MRVSIHLFLLNCRLILEQQYYATMRPSMRLMFDDFMDLTSEFLPLTVNVLQEAMESLESVVSASDDTVARTLNMVRLLVRREAHNSVEPEHSVEVSCDDFYPIIYF